MKLPGEYTMRYAKWHHVHTPFPPEMIVIQTKLLEAWPQLWPFFRWFMYTFGYVWNNCQGMGYDYTQHHRRDLRNLRGYYAWWTAERSKPWVHLDRVPDVHRWIIPEHLR